MEKSSGKKIVDIEKNCGKKLVAEKNSGKKMFDKKNSQLFFFCTFTHQKSIPKICDPQKC